MTYNFTLSVTLDASLSVYTSTQLSLLTPPLLQQSHLLTILKTSKAFPALQSKMISIKQLAETPGLDSIPSTYVFTRNPIDDDQLVSDDPEHPIPVIDFSLLTSGTPDQRSKVVHDLGFACQDWGFFMVNELCSRQFPVSGIYMFHLLHYCTFEDMHVY